MNDDSRIGTAKTPDQNLNKDAVGQEKLQSEEGKAKNEMTNTPSQATVTPGPAPVSRSTGMKGQYCHIFVSKSV